MLQLKNEDLVKYTDKDGNITFPENVTFQGNLNCKGNLNCEGGLYCKGSLYCEGYLNCKGNLYCKGGLYCEGYLNCEGSLNCEGNLNCKGNLNCEGYLYCGGNLNCKGSLNCEGTLYCEGKHFIVMGTFYWSHASMPKIPEKHYINLLMPQPWQREHYADRLGFEIRGCYEEICMQVGRKVFRLLKDDKWLPLERKMLECIRDHEKPAPEWVDEARKD